MTGTPTSEYYLLGEEINSMDLSRLGQNRAIESFRIHARPNHRCSKMALLPRNQTETIRHRYLAGCLFHMKRTNLYR
jgi:hypothetical protein